jgi:signal transduction histidine kinase
VQRAVWRLTARRAHLAVVAAGVVAGLLDVLVAANNNPHPDARINLLVYMPVEILVGWTFLFVGLVAGRRRPDNRVGLLMSIFGLTWFGFLLQYIRVPVVYFLADAFSGFPLVILAQLFIVYPRGTLAGRLEKLVMAAVYGWLVFTALSQMVTWNLRAVDCFFCLTNPYYIPGTSWLNAPFGAVSSYGTVVVAVLVLAILLWHWLQASTPTRRAMTPAVWAALPVFAQGVAGLFYKVGVIPDHVQSVLKPVEWLTFAILPVGLLIGLLRTRLGRAAVSDLLVELSRLQAPGTLRDSLARALGDPSVELALALPDGSYVDSGGRSVPLPAAGSGRAVTAIESDGKPLAALIHDPAVDEEDPGLVEAAGSAARLALEREQLQAQVRASLEDVRASRVRIQQAADSERRRLERDIHDGAQQRLVALGVALRLARDRAASRGDQALVGDLDGAAGQLKQALSEIRDLAQGIHPAVLSRAGIGPALRVLAEVSPIPVEISDPPAERYSDDVEAAVYFVVSEALANAAKHSGAKRIDVSVRREGGTLLVDVRDDGLGGATATNGSGLVGMTDRVAILGGVVNVASPRGAGTLVHAEIPCA